jgi:hypothetical protein
VFVAFLYLYRSFCLGHYSHIVLICSRVAAVISVVPVRRVSLDTEGLVEAFDSAVPTVLRGHRILIVDV